MSEHTLDSSSKLEEKLFLLGRILMSILFFVPAYRKASSIDGTIAYFGKLGLPFLKSRCMWSSPLSSS